MSFTQHDFLGLLADSSPLPPQNYKKHATGGPALGLAKAHEASPLAPRDSRFGSSGESSAFLDLLFSGSK
jgi:hypothetical protein